MVATMVTADERLALLALAEARRQDEFLLSSLLLAATLRVSMVVAVATVMPRHTRRCEFRRG